MATVEAMPAVMMAVLGEEAKVVEAKVEAKVEAREEGGVEVTVAASVAVGLER